jgi:hypothetical protein
MRRAAGGGVSCQPPPTLRTLRAMPAARWRRWIGLGWTVRRALRTLDRIDARLEAQNGLLARLADHYAPLPAAPDRQVAHADTGVTFLDPIELILAQQYVARTRSETGHDPSDDEVLTYLADEKTVDLQRRLVAREQELEARAVRR